MRRPWNRRWAAGTAAAGLAAVAAVSYGVIDRHESAADGPIKLQLAANASSTDKGTFTIGGTTVTGLYPGASAPMSISATNPNSFDIDITSLSATVKATSNPRCPTTSLTTGAYQGSPDLPITLAKNQQRALGTFPLKMPTTAGDACQGVTFTIALSGTATKAGK